MTTNPYESPETSGNLVPRKSLWPSLWQVLTVVGVLGLLDACLMPQPRMAREAARRMQCNNHLRQIAIALQNYHDAYQCLPPAYTVDAAGKPLHSWRTLILPFMEGKAVYDKIDLSKPWDDPVNKAV